MFVDRRAAYIRPTEDDTNNHHPILANRVVVYYTPVLKREIFEEEHGQVLREAPSRRLFFCCLVFRTLDLVGRTHPSGQGRLLADDRA
jgi:hypothetical protein